MNGAGEVGVELGAGHTYGLEERLEISVMLKVDWVGKWSVWWNDPSVSGRHNKNQVSFTEMGTCRKRGASAPWLSFRDHRICLSWCRQGGRQPGREGAGWCPQALCDSKVLTATGCCPFSWGRARVLELVLDDPDAQF